MNQQLNIGDYIVFIPRSKSKKITEMQKYVVEENFFCFPRVLYNTKYKIIGYNKHYNRNVIQLGDDEITMYQLNRFKIEYKIISQLHLKINKIIKL